MAKVGQIGLSELRLAKRNEGGTVESGSTIKVVIREVRKCREKAKQSNKTK